MCKSLFRRRSQKMMSEIILYIILFVVGICAFLALAGSGTQNYCRCIQEPRADDDDLYSDFYSEREDNVSEVNWKYCIER